MKVKLISYYTIYTTSTSTSSRLILCCPYIPVDGEEFDYQREGSMSDSNLSQSHASVIIDNDGLEIGNYLLVREMS